MKKKPDIVKLGCIVLVTFIISACSNSVLDYYRTKYDPEFMNCKNCGFNSKSDAVEKTTKEKIQTTLLNRNKPVQSQLCDASTATCAVDKLRNNRAQEWCEVPPMSRIYPRRQGPLTETERKMARIAWRYFENNYDENTGLVNAVNAYPSTTMWDTSSYLGGMMAAYELGIIEKSTMDKRFRTFLKTMNQMDLFRGELPNKAYHTGTAEKVNYGNQPGEIGYSALDLGRLMIWLRIYRGRYPEYASAIDNVLMRWNYCNVVDEQGTMFGAILDEEKNIQYLQEGRLGYEEYAAKGFQLWGFDTTLSSLAEPYDEIPIFDVLVPYDTRDPRELKAHNYVVNESYVLDALELNWDHFDDPNRDVSQHSDHLMVDFGHRVYATQQARYCETGILTARTEHQLDGPPYFVYDTIYTDGYSWNTITETGEHVPQFSSIALKGALGMWAVWDSEYTDLLFDAVSGLYDPDKGFYEGLYENGTGLINTFTANNNGIILESLLFKERGKILTHNGVRGPWDALLENPFKGKQQCFPHQRETKSCGQCCGKGSCKGG